MLIRPELSYYFSLVTFHRVDRVRKERSIGIKVTNSLLLELWSLQELPFKPTLLLQTEIILDEDIRIIYTSFGSFTVLKIYNIIDTPDFFYPKEKFSTPFPFPMSLKMNDGSDFF